MPYRAMPCHALPKHAVNCMLTTIFMQRGSCWPWANRTFVYTVACLNLKLLSLVFNTVYEVVSKLTLVCYFFSKYTTMVMMTLCWSSLLECMYACGGDIVLALHDQHVRLYCCCACELQSKVIIRCSMQCMKCHPHVMWIHYNGNDDPALMIFVECMARRCRGGWLFIISMYVS